MKRFLALILCIILINTGMEASATEEIENYGYISYERKALQIKEEPETVFGFSLMGSATLPERYDSRDYNFVSPVKNQGSDGTCWTFAAIGALESYLLKFVAQKDADGKVINNREFDFSENHMRYMMSNQFNNPHGYSVKISNGGNTLMSSSYFLGDYGPANEGDDPYPTNDKYRHRDYAGTKDIPLSDYRVDCVEFIPQYRSIEVDSAKQTLIDKTKKLVMDYGSAVCGVNYSATYLNGDKTALYCNNGDDGVNHQVLIVGWDDTYSKTNFKNPPLTDGAFIIKNSHGPNDNENGYFYLSYCDINLFSDVMAITKVTKREQGELLYNLDPFGTVSAFSLGSADANPVSYGNVFNKKTQNESLVGVSFYAYEGVNYDIYIINSAPSDAEETYVYFEDYLPQLVYKGATSSNNGYKTVRFNGVEITNDKFAVMIKADSNSIVPLPLESNAFASSNGVLVPFIDGVTIEKKQSFYVEAGDFGGWFFDAYKKNGNFSIKAITKTSDPYVEFELANITDSYGKIVTDFENADEVHIVPAMNYANLDDKQILCIGYKGNKMMMADYKNVGQTNKFVFTDIPKDFGDYTFYMYVWGLNGLRAIGNGIKVGTN